MSTLPASVQTAPTHRGEGSRALGAALRDYVSLTKPRLSALVLFTTAGGIWFSGASMSFAHWFGTLAATFGIVGAANALNCGWEWDTDGLMERTRRRPIPQGRLTVTSSVWFALLSLALSLPLLYWASNALTVLLGLFALVSYVFAYTPLKRTSDMAYLVGAIPGALPPLMGSTAGTDAIGLPGIELFLILLFWQLPHFLAIALFRKDEYARAGLKSVPLVRGDAVARTDAGIYSVMLVLVTAVPVLTGTAGLFYAASAGLLGAVLLAVVFDGTRARRGHRWARRLFGTTLVYLSLLMVGLLVDRLVVATLG